MCEIVKQGHVRPPADYVPFEIRHRYPPPERELWDQWDDENGVTWRRIRELERHERSRGRG